MAGRGRGQLLPGTVPLHAGSGARCCVYAGHKVLHCICSRSSGTCVALPASDALARVPWHPPFLFVRPPVQG